MHPANQGVGVPPGYYDLQGVKFLKIPIALMVPFKSLIRRIIPGPVLKYFTGFFYGWSGNYPDWNTAKQKCSGYDSPVILEKVRQSALKVRRGDLPYERDSVVYNQIQYSYPLLAGLMWISARNKGNLNVLDFGGSLGSSYYQNLPFLLTLESVNWSIVEQPDFVRAGREDFSEDNLHFYYSVDDCLKERKIDVCLLSSVLQYLENPIDLLNLLKQRRIPFIILDRTPFINDKDRITIQKVHPAIYKAKYPCWFFNKNKLINFMMPEYNLILEFDALDKANIRSEFKGFIFELKT